MGYFCCEPFGGYEPSVSLVGGMTQLTAALMRCSTCIWMGRYNHSLSLDATIMVSKTAQSLVNTLSSFS